VQTAPQHHAPAASLATTRPDLAAVKARQRTMWGLGDYAVIGTTLPIVAESLCEAADVRKGSFYHWFPSKQALAVAVAERSWERLRHRLSTEVFVADGRPVIDEFAAYAEVLRESMRSHGREVLGCRFGNLAVELAVTDAVIRAALADIFTELTAMFERSIERAIERRELSAELDARWAARATCAHMEGLMVLAKTYQDASVIDDLVPVVAALLGSSARPSETRTRSAGSAGSTAPPGSWRRVSGSRTGGRSSR